ncbi:hypothetical protein MKW98_012344 [Papaver atlanticum]|uniref:BZIP domain-containing protein n=1 Tax=Papaver atlanticum TaxID=357466 RepID=A0AAD4XM37_9MAGN|nr:hypothetical protein MKW98_012344 [Papaver atlanticum]
MFLSEEMFGIPYPIIGNGFTPCENQDDGVEITSFFLSLLSSSPETTTTTTNSVLSTNSSLSNDTTRAVSEEAQQERKKRRMISNRESARRSRMRKQKHLEDLRVRLNKMKFENREMKNRLSCVVQNTQLFRRDNDKLRFESEILRRKLSDIRRILILRKLHQQFSSMNGPLN